MLAPLAHMSTKGQGGSHLVKGRVAPRAAGQDPEAEGDVLRQGHDRYLVRPAASAGTDSICPGRADPAKCGFG